MSNYYPHSESYLLMQMAAAFESLQHAANQTWNMYVDHIVDKVVAGDIRQEIDEDHIRWGMTCAKAENAEQLLQGVRLRLHWAYEAVHKVRPEAPIPLAPRLLSREMDTGDAHQLVMVFEASAPFTA